jgi:glycosyltransferase involved in cell wall biosynthesis
LESINSILKINLICQYYPPEIGAPQARLSEMAREWIRQGHDVTVLTGFPNHPTGIVPEEYRGRLFMKEFIDGIQIWRHWLYATPNEGFLKKTFAHISFMVTLILFSLFRGERPDVLIVSSPNFFSVISTYVMSRIRRVPYIFEVRDLWPGIFIELGVLKNRYLIRFLEIIELFLYRHAAAVVPVTKGFADDIINRGILSNRVEVITNGADLETFTPDGANSELRRELNLPLDAFIILYIGAHGISHGLHSVIDAAELMKNDDKVHFLFVGEGAEKVKLISLAQKKQLRNVTFIKGQFRKKVIDFYHLADACIVPLKNIPGLGNFIPSKMFEIMACGRTIIASLHGEAARILTRSGSAVVIPPEDPNAIVRVIENLRNDPENYRCMGVAGRKFVEKYYDRKFLAKRYLTLLSRIVCEY